jgi:uncharacterized membrane protein
MIPESRERGAVIPFLALCVGIIVLVGAFTVDLGRAMVLRRDLQRVADISALDASKFLTSGSATSQIATVRNAAVRSAARNGFTLDPLDVHLVQQSGTTWTRIDNSNSVPDGVEVQARGSVSYNFHPGSATTSRNAIASRQSGAGIEIGTNLATIDSSQGDMLNRVFTLFGNSSGINLDLVSWQGLADANVTLGDLVAAAGSDDADSFLETSVSYGSQLTILANALSAKGNTLAAGYVNAYRTALGASVSGILVKAGDFLKVSAPDADAFADASINALSLLQGELLLARSGSAVSGTVKSGISGIADVTLTAQVVSPPTIAFGPVGTSASTGQISVSLRTNLLALVPIQLGITAATGTATLSSIACSGIGPSSSATASVQTSLSGLTLSVLGLPVSLGLTAVPPTTKTFSPAFTWAHSQHVGATSLGLSGAIGGALSPLVLGLVNGLLGPLENAVLSPILRSLGISVAGADVAVLGPVCLPPTLAR